MTTASVIAIVMSFSAATILYLFVEQPSMRARALPTVRRLTQRTAVDVQPVARA